MKLLIATTSGLLIADYTPGGEPAGVQRTLAGQHVTTVIAREGVILAGTTAGVQRSTDGGQHWQAVNRGLDEPHVRWLAYHPGVSDLEFAGTEPAGIYVSRDGGDHWRACPEVGALRDKHNWFLPYSPEAGCVRGFGFHGNRAYAAVEVGGALRSDDGGQTWRLAEGSDGSPDLDGPPEPFVYPDVHSIHVHPSSPDLVIAPTGGGFYRSLDGGRTWQLLYDCYCRAAWIDPDDPDHIILGPADGVDEDGRIEMTRDGGRTWQPASEGLKVPWRRGMVERFLQAGDELLAVLSGGQVIAAPLAELKWRYLVPQIKGAEAIAIVT